MRKITASELYDELNSLNLNRATGQIIFSLSGITVKIKTTDIVGCSIQSWLGKYFEDNDIYFDDAGTQEFPDFLLDDVNHQRGLLEVKAFNYDASPAFDIANFDSYCDSIKEKPYRLDADYLVFGYLMNEDGDILIERIWLKKIWQIAGKSNAYPLKTQVKRGVIYNIRPEGNFKFEKPSTFINKDDFLKALYGTLEMYKGREFAESWKKVLGENYKNYFGSVLPF